MTVAAFHPINPSQPHQYLGKYVGNINIPLKCLRSLRAHFCENRISLLALNVGNGGMGSLMMIVNRCGLGHSPIPYSAQMEVS